MEGTIKQATNIPSWATIGLMGLGVVGIIALTLTIGFKNTDQDKSNEIKKQLGIMAGVSALIVVLFAGAAYMYFTVNINQLTPFLFIMSFVNVFISIIAVSAASLNVTN